MTTSNLLVIVLLTNLLVTPLYAQLNFWEVGANSVFAFSTLTDVEQLADRNFPQNVFSQESALLVAITIINDTPYQFLDFIAKVPESTVGDPIQTKAVMQPQVIASGGTGVAVYRKAKYSSWSTDMIDLELSFNVYLTDGSRSNLVYQFMYKDDGSNPNFSLKIPTDTLGGGRELKAGVFGTTKIPLGSNFGCRHWINDRVEAVLHFVNADFNTPDFSLENFTNDTYYIGTPIAKKEKRLTDQDYLSNSQCTALVQANSYDTPNSLPAQQQMFWIKKLFGGDFIIYNALTYRALSWDSKSKSLESCRPPQENLDDPLPLDYRWTISYHPDTEDPQAPMIICTQRNHNLCLHFTDSGGWSVEIMDGSAEFGVLLEHTSKSVRETLDNSVTSWNLILADEPEIKLFSGPQSKAIGLAISERPTEEPWYTMHFLPDGAYYKIFDGSTRTAAHFLSVPKMNGLTWDLESKKYPRDQHWTVTKSNTEPPFYLLQNEAYGCYLARSAIRGPHEQMDAVVDDHEQKEVEEEFLGRPKEKYGRDLECSSTTLPTTNYGRFKWKLDFVK